MIYHNVIININDDSTGQSSEMIDIIQGSDNGHTISIKLTKGEFNRPYNLANQDPIIEFTIQDPETKIDQVERAVNAKIVNTDRGELSWIVSSKLLRDIGRYTVLLTLYNKWTNSKVQCTFIINVTSSPVSIVDPSTVNVEITQEFYNTLVSATDSLKIKELKDPEDTSSGTCPGEDSPTTYPNILTCATQKIFDTNSSALKDNDITIVEDSRRIYKGQNLIANVGCQIVTQEPTVDNTFPDCLYIYTPEDDVPEMWFNNGTEVIKLSAAGSTKGAVKSGMAMGIDILEPTKFKGPGTKEPFEGKLTDFEVIGSESSLTDPQGQLMKMDFCPAGNYVENPVLMKGDTE